MNLLLSIVTAIAKYMREEAQRLNMMPQQSICEVQPDVSKQLKITEVVQNPWFGVTVSQSHQINLVK